MTEEKHSPLFAKIIKAREDAGLPKPSSTLSPDQLQIVKELKDAKPGTKITRDNEVWMKG